MVSDADVAGPSGPSSIYHETDSCRSYSESRSPVSDGQKAYSNDSRSPDPSKAYMPNMRPEISRNYTDTRPLNDSRIFYDTTRNLNEPRNYLGEGRNLGECSKIHPLCDSHLVTPKSHLQTPSR